MRWRLAFGVFIAFCGCIGGLAMVIHGINTGRYNGDWGVFEGVVLIVMSLVVYAAFVRADNRS